MKCAIFLLLILSLVSCGPSPEPTQPAAVPAFSAWADGFANEWVSASPQLGTRTQWFSGEKQNALDRQLTLVGEWDYAYGKALVAQAERARKGLETLKTMDLGSLPPAEQTSADVIRW